jgi:nucleotide-binding universal stress UspA family protein
VAGAIVIGYDGSDSGEDALALGVGLAGAVGDLAVVVTVYPEEETLSPARVDAEWVAYVREQAEHALDGARRLLGSGTRAEYRTLGASSPSRGLDALAREIGASMIVLGSSRRGPLRRLVAGSTAQRLMHGGTCAVAVAPRGLRARERLTLRTIGCAFVDTPDGHAALEAAASLARRIPRARLRAFTVVARHSEVFDVPMLGRDPDAAWLEHTRAAFGQAMDAALAALPGDLDASGELLEGDVVDALAALDERDCDLLVCGSRAYGPIGHVLLGGVASRLLRHAASPVMVVPRAGGERAGADAA